MARAHAPGARRDTRETPSIVTVWIAAKATSTGLARRTRRARGRRGTGRAAARSPRVPIAAIACGRSAGGIRSVRIVWMLGLQMPFATPLAKHGEEAAPRADIERQQPERRAWNGTDSAMRRSPSIRSARKRNERTLPQSEPAPNAAKSSRRSARPRRSARRRAPAPRRRTPARPRRRRGTAASRRAAAGRGRGSGSPDRSPRDSAGRRRALRRRHEQRDEQERHEVGGRVDDEHVAAPKTPIRTPRERRAEQHRRADRALEERVRLADGPLVLAEELRQDHPLRREERRAEHAEQQREHEQRPEREVRRSSAAPARAASRRARGVGEQHRRAARRAGAASGPAGRPAARSRASSAAITNVIRVAEPDVTSTNQGSASQVICVPVSR